MLSPERFAELHAAYEATLYRAGGLVLRVGDHGPDAASWAFLTSCNPMSEPLPDEENASRILALRADLAAYEIIEGEGVSPDGLWREASFLVLGIDKECATRLAVAYRQAAYLFGVRGQPARLVWPSLP